MTFRFEGSRARGAVPEVGGVARDVVARHRAGSLAPLPVALADGLIRSDTAAGKDEHDPDRQRIGGRRSTKRRASQRIPHPESQT